MRILLISTNLLTFMSFPRIPYPCLPESKVCLDLAGDPGPGQAAQHGTEGPPPVQGACGSALMVTVLLASSRYLRGRTN